MESNYTVSSGSLIVSLMFAIHNHSLRFPGTSVSLSNTSLTIIGNLTVSGAPLELHLDNATVAVSGDLRLDAGLALSIAFSSPYRKNYTE